MSQSNKGDGGRHDQAKPPVPPRPLARAKADVIPEGPQTGQGVKSDEQAGGNSENCVIFSVLGDPASGVPGQAGTPEESGVVDGERTIKAFQGIPIPSGARVKDADLLSEGLQGLGGDISTLPTNPELQVPSVDEIAVRLEASLAEKFGRHGYTFIAKIGEGGMGNVYLARDEGLDRDVAIKVMNADMFGNEMARVRFAKEARALGKLNHPNITIVYAFKQDKDGTSFIVQEKLEGKDMHELQQQKGCMDPETLQKLFIQACDGFATAHAAGIIHRDIKPENLFVVGTNGRQMVKIMDFGIAKVEDKKAGESFRTQVGFTMGSIDYLSPEQAEGKEVDSRADIYSLGATMYEMATGVTPFQSSGDCTTPAAHFAEIFPKIRSERPIPPSLKVPMRNIPKELDSIIMRCLEKDPADRYQTMSDLQEALKRLDLKAKAKPQEGSAVLAGVAVPKPSSKPADANLPSIMVSNSIHGVEVDGKRRTAVAAQKGSPKPIPLSDVASDGTAAQQAEDGKKVGSKTLITGFEVAAKAREGLSRKNKRIAAAVVGAVAGLGFITGLALVAPGIIRTHTQSQSTPSGIASQNPGETGTARNTPPSTAPLVTAIVDAGASGTAAAMPLADTGPAEARSYTITIRTAPAGVEVFDEQNSLCTTSAAEPCRVSFEADAGQVRLRFRKRGYADVERTLVPDSDQTLDISLEPARAQRPGVRPPVKQGGRPGSRTGGEEPLITSEE